jgi:hypothetical protein
LRSADQGGEPRRIMTQSLDGRLTQMGPRPSTHRRSARRPSWRTWWQACSPRRRRSPTSLPHVALSRRTLPWEREGRPRADDAAGAAAVQGTELRNAERENTPAVSVTQLKVHPGSDNDQADQHAADPGETEVSTLAVANSLLRQIVPRIAEPRPVPHEARNRERCRCGPCDRGLQSAADASAPAGEKPEVHTAMLVSVERAPELFTLRIPARPRCWSCTTDLRCGRRLRAGDQVDCLPSHGRVLQFGNLPAPLSRRDRAALGGFRELLTRTATS